MMFETEVRDKITKRIQEVIMLVMMGSKQCERFRDQLFVVRDLIRAHFQSRLAVAHHIDLERRRALRQLDAAEVTSGDYRRIDQRRQADRFKGYCIGLLIHGQGRSKFPTGWQPQACVVAQVIRLPTLRVEQELIPAYYRELRGRGGCRGKSVGSRGQ